MTQEGWVPCACSPGCPVGRGEKGVSPRAGPLWACLFLLLPPLPLGSFWKPPEYTCLPPLPACNDSRREVVGQAGDLTFFSCVLPPLG